MHLQKEQLLLFLSTKQAGFVVSCPLIIACSAFADTPQKRSARFSDEFVKNFAPEQFKNAENCCYDVVFALFGRHYNKSVKVML